MIKSLLFKFVYEISFYESLIIIYKLLVSMWQYINSVQKWKISNSKIFNKKIVEILIILMKGKNSNQTKLYGSNLTNMSLYISQMCKYFRMTSIKTHWNNIEHKLIKMEILYIYMYKCTWKDQCNWGFGVGSLLTTL